MQQWLFVWQLFLHYLLIVAVAAVAAAQHLAQNQFAQHHAPQNLVHLHAPQNLAHLHVLQNHAALSLALLDAAAAHAMDANHKVKCNQANNNKVK